MHSRIFQVYKDPKQEKNTNDEDDYYAKMRGIADYVDGPVDDPEGDFEWLGTNPGLKVNLKKKTLTIADKKAYFANKYQEFHQLAIEMAAMTEDQFVNDKYGLAVYDLHRSYDDEGDFYIDDGVNFATLDTFVRWANNGDTYYFGDVFDYHM